MSNDVWCKKLKCSCGSSFNRSVWRRINGVPQYAYQCYNQIRTGTVKTRTNKGLSTEGICEVSMIPGWKLGAMADIIFQKFWNDRDGVIRIANEMLDKHFYENHVNEFEEEIKAIQNKIDRLNVKYDNLVEMRMAGEIDKAKFNEKKQQLQEEIEHQTNLLVSYQIEEDVSDEDYKSRLEILKYGLERDFNFSTHCILEEVIDAFVEEIIAHKDCFVWKLRLFDDTIKLSVNGKKNNAVVSLIEYPSVDKSKTGSYR